MQDDKGNPTVAAAKAPSIRTEFKDGEPFMDFLPVPLQLNRPGKYKVVLPSVRPVAEVDAGVQP